MSKFYFFRQNNSGGDFVVNENVAQNVIIEAHSAKQAIALGEVVGLYFDGFGDCRCCGRRWNDYIDDEDGTEVPTIYDKPVHEYKPSFWDETCVIHYLDGRKERIELECA